MKKRVLYVVLLSTILWMLGACAPKAAPAPAPPASVPAVPSPALAPTPTLSSGESAWARVVEAAKKEGLVTIYGSSQFAGDGGRVTAAAFQDKYGIRVELLSIAGRQIVERLKVETQVKQPIGDIAGTGVSSSTELSLAGLLVSVWRELPELKDRAVFKVEPVYTPSGDVLNMSMSLTGAGINTKLVKPQDEPRSFLELLDLKWKGKMIVADPRGGAGSGFSWFGMMRYYKLLDDEYFRGFKRQEPILWGGGTAEELNMVARGEVWLDANVSQNSVGALIVEGAPLKILGVKEGSIVSMDPIAMVKGAAHPNAAKMFINWILSREGQTIYGKAVGGTSIRQDVPDFVDPRARVQPEPQKLLEKTYEVAEVTNRYHKEAIAESIFGKK